MAGDPPSSNPRNDDDLAGGTNRGYQALSYLIGGILVWGFVGWLIDHYGHTGGIATAIGVVIGAAGGVYLLVRRMGS
jgi:ATP synthase protein I